MSSLMDSVDSCITPDVTSSLAARFSVPAASASSALITSAAAMLTTLGSKAHDREFISEIYSLVVGSNAMAAAPGTARSGSAISTTTASEFLSQVFGGQLSNVQAKVAEAAAIPSPAAGGMLMAASPMVITALAGKAQAEGIDAGSFGQLLTTEMPDAHSFLPAGFAVPLVAAFSGSTSTRASATAHTEDTKGATGWLWSVLLIGAVFIGGLVWYFSYGESQVKPTETGAQTKSSVTDSATKASAAIATGTSDSVAALGAFLKRKLADGTELNVPENGIESKLVAYIEDPTRKPNDTTVWFDFDRLLFATGSATLEASSAEQLSNVSAILKAYPKVDIRLGGYTDNTGDPEANKKLSTERANTVKAELVKLGVEQSRIDAWGYGDEHPVASNDTEAGRAKNRRISLRLLDEK